MAKDRLAEDLVTLEWPIEAYLRTLRGKLDHRADAIDLVSEAEDHVREAAERLVDRGWSRFEAESTAVARLGDLDLVAALLATKVQPDPRGRLDRLRGPVALAAAGCWLVTVAVYLGQALHQPWQLDHFQIWCNVAAATLAVTAASLLSRLKPHLLPVALLPVVFALHWQQDAETGWRWWVCGSVVGLIALGGLHRRFGRGAALAVAFAWPLAFAIQHAAKVMQVGPLDEWGEPIVAPLIAYAVGATVTAVGLASLRPSREKGGPPKVTAKPQRRRLIALGSALLMLLLPACTSATSPDRGALSFADCPAELAAQLAEFAPGLAPKVELGCAELAVPLDHARPEGEQITLKIIRARHQEQSDRIGSLIHNPGGPGEPGLDYVPFLLSWVPESVLKRFDLVSFDPRGTGGSAPINCPALPDDPQATTPNVLTEAGFAETARLERQYNQACLDVLTSRAPHFTTQATARDLDRLRVAVGDQALTYLGGSYGAKLGAEYARLFPASVRAAVLDGPSEPSATVFDSIVRQTKGFEDGFDQYAKSCATRFTCQLGDPRAFVARLVARADAAPIPSRRSSADGSADGTDVLDAVRAALAAEVRWPDLDTLLYEASEFGDSSGVFAMKEVVYGPPVEDSAPADKGDANYVINCNDSAVGPTDEQIRATARTMARDYPLFGAHAAYNLFGCKTWQPQRSVLELPVAPTPNRLLVIGTVHDAVTPYVGAVALTKALGHATLLTWDGNYHTAMASSTCIADIAARYLIDLTVPPDGTHCPP